MSFEEVVSQVDDWVTEGMVPGVSIAVEHRGTLVAKHHAGEARSGEPVTDDTLFGLASLSKPITAAAFLTLADEGLVDLDAPVTDVLPEFGADVDPLQSNAMLEAQRDDITFRKLLAHTSGLPENISTELFQPASLASREKQTDMMLRTPLQAAPGERLRYSNLGPGIAARAAEVVTGRDFLDIVRERVLNPMGLSNIVLNPTPEEADRIAHLKDPAHEGTRYESYNSAWWRETAIPWGGYYGSAPDMLRFTSSFLPGRENGLSAESRRAMTSDQVHGLEGGVDSMRTIWDPGFWACGWEIKGSKPKHWTGNLTSANTWDHWGFAGTLAWADPDRDLAVTVFANRSVSSLWMFRPARWAKLCDDICNEADANS